MILYNSRKTAREVIFLAVFILERERNVLRSKKE